MPKSSNRHILSPCFTYPRTLQNSETQMLGELSRITALKLKKGCRDLLPNKHHPQSHIPFTTSNIQHVRNSKSKQMEECLKASYTAVPKTLLCSVSYHLISNLLSLQKLYYFLLRRNEHRKLTHIFCQLPSTANSLTWIGKWFLETRGLSVPGSVTQIIYCGIKPSTHPQSTNLLDWDGYPCWSVPPKDKYHKHHAFWQKNQLSPARG